jgi:predicted small lipoprotein YifL
MTCWARPRRLARALLALAILLLALPGCGRKGPPVPPRPLAPAAPSPVRAELEDGAIVVTWARPTRNEDGTPLANLQEFRLYRAVSQGTPPSTGPQPGFSLLATVQADHPDNASVMGDLYAFRDEGEGRGLTPGTRYIYRVQAVNRRGTTGPPSVEATADFSMPPPAPTSLAVVARNGVVDLTWQAPALSPSGASVLRGYNVYRGIEPGQYGPEPVNGRLIQEPRYQDPGVASDVT